MICCTLNEGIMSVEKKMDEGLYQSITNKLTKQGNIEGSTFVFRFRGLHSWSMDKYNPDAALFQAQCGYGVLLILVANNGTQLERN